MAVEKMWMMRASGKLEQLDAFIDRCCLDGRVQVEPASEFIPKSMGYTPLSEPNDYAERLAAVQEVAASFGRELHYRDEVRDSRDDAQVDSELLSAMSKQMKELQDRRTALLAAQEEDDRAVRDLQHFVQMDLPLSELYDSKFIRFRFGRMPADNLEKLHRFDEYPYLLFFPCSREGEEVWGVYFAPVNKVDEVDRLFAALYFQWLRLPKSFDTPDKAVEELQRRLERTGTELAEIDEQLRRFWDDQQEACDFMYSRLLYRNGLHEIRSRAVVHGEYFFLCGWVPVKEAAAVRKAAEAVGVELTLEKPSTSSHPPTKMKNSCLIRPYEEFVEMYGIPGYHDIDPTLFLSIVYTVLFGIMFADLGQGLCVAALGLVLWLRNRSRMGGILLRCGLSSAVFGTVFGSVFGNEEALDGFYENVLHMHKPIAIMQDITLILVTAIGIGVFLLIVAMGLNIAACLKRRQPGQALFGENGLTGMVVYICLVLQILRFMGGEMFAAIPAAWITWPLVVGFLILYFKEILIGLAERKPDWKPESWGDYLLANLFELIEYVLSYFSNTVSFLRVGAFVLVHAGMMLVVYSMAPAAGAGRILVLVLGNLLIMGIEGVLTYIQVLRLGFYEMFSRFYQGDGKPFHPFRLGERIRQKQA